MISLTYTRFEMLRTLRNRRFLLFSLIFPLILYYAVAGPNRDCAIASARKMARSRVNIRGR